MTILAAAERYYEQNAEAVDRIVEELRAAGAEESALDDIAHDVAEEGEASDLNNAGMTFQVASALEGNGVEEGRRVLFETAGLAPRQKP